MTSPVLDVQGVSKRFGGLQALSDVGLRIEPGQIYGLIGPNGAGKTTSFYMVTDLVKPNEGHVFLDEIDITREPMYRRALLGVGQFALQQQFQAAVHIDAEHRRVGLRVRQLEAGVLEFEHLL